MTLNKDFNRSLANVTGNKTLTAADSGIVQVVKADGVVITLPATAADVTFTIRNGSTYDGQYAFTVAPAAADGVTGNGFTAAINKAIVSSKATSRAADEFTISGTGTTGATGWIFQEVIGTVTRAAQLIIAEALALSYVAHSQPERSKGGST